MCHRFFMINWLIMVQTLLILDIATTVLSATTATSNDTVTLQPLTATYGTTTPAAVSTIPDVVMTLVVIAACALVGLGVAKLGDYCYDRRMAMKDDISNASEYTKNLLRARLAVMKMKPDPEASDQKNAKQAASTWMQTASKTRKDSELEEVIAEKLQGATITIEDEAESPHATAVNPANTNSTDTNTTTTQSRHTLPQNKVTPGDETSAMAGGQLPPLKDIPQRPKTPLVTDSKSINQPIRSTR